MDVFPCSMFYKSLLILGFSVKHLRCLGRVYRHSKHLPRFTASSSQTFYYNISSYLSIVRFSFSFFSFINSLLVSKSYPLFNLKITKIQVCIRIKKSFQYYFLSFFLVCGLFSLSMDFFFAFVVLIFLPLY